MALLVTRGEIRARFQIGCNGICDFRCKVGSKGRL